jgi:hypothetical protein
MQTTPFDIRCEILADLWMEYRQDEQFKDFVEYNDLGLPLSYAIANSIVESSQMAESFVNEAFDLLVTGLGLEEDTGFENLTDLLEGSEIEE